MSIGSIRSSRTFITRRESPADPPNFFLRTLAKTPLTDVPEGEASWTSTARAITHFPDPRPNSRHHKAHRHVCPGRRRAAFVHALFAAGL